MSVRCIDSQEICRIRASILPIISGILFVFAVVSLISSVGNKDLVKFLMDDSNDENLRSIITNFHNAVYVPFAIVFIVHLLRVYLSMLVIDEDPEFFYANLRPLSKNQRMCEYFLRSFILVTLLLLVKDHTKTIELLAWIGLSDNYFAPTLIVYISLLLWDIFMFFSLGFKSFSRIMYFLSDVTGLLMAGVLLGVEGEGFKSEMVPMASGGMYLLIVLSVVWLLLDIVWPRDSNWRDFKQWCVNLKKYISHFLLFRYYFEFPCNEDCPLSSPCPVEENQNNSGVTNDA